MGFQTEVHLNLAPAVEGDFASGNPRAAVLAPEGGFVAGPLGVIVGRFAWIEADGRTVTSYGQAGVAPAGFVHRDQQGLITTYLTEAGMTIPAGFPVVLHNEGDFFAKNAGPSASTMKEAIYAGYADGNAYMGAAPTGASVTGLMGSTNTAAIGATFTASANGGDATQLDVTSVTGVLSIGDKVAGTGITPGTTITGQVSGSAGAEGTYQLSAANTASAATVTSFGATLVISATTGIVSIGDKVAGGAGFPAAGTTILAQVSGTAGGAGTYTLSAPATAYVASATGVTTFGNVLNVTAIGSGVLAVGEAISGTGIPTGASIESQVSGTPGGIGVYTTNIPATAYAASTTITVVGGIITNYQAESVVAVGELVKISTWGKA